jgi:glutamate-1-semialdehyde aminotransferase
LRFNLEPDIAVFAKTISNGYPMGGIIGTRKAMEGALQSFISSAYWSEAVGPAAALATLKKMKEVDVVGHLTRIGKLVKATWETLARNHGLEIDIVGHDPLPGFRFTHPEGLALETLLTVRMLKAGYLATTNAVVTMAHEEHHIEAYARALDPVFAELKEATEREDIKERIGGPVKSSGFARLT